MKPRAPCFVVPPELLEKADAAEDRLSSALARVAALLAPKDDAFGSALIDLIDADKQALKARGK